MNHSHLKKASALVATLLVLVTAPVAAEVLYRWVDEQGNQVNSDRPPPAGIEYETISTSSDMVRTLQTETAATEEQETAPASVTPAPGEQVEYEDDRRVVIEKDPELCARAQDNLATLDSKARIRIRNEDGEVRFMQEGERAAERDKAIGAIESYCE